MRHTLFLLAAISLVGCNSNEHATPPPSEVKTQPVQAAPEPAPKAAAEKPATEAAPANSPPSQTKEGWTSIAKNDEVPLCVFASLVARDDADFLHQVKKQKLVADTEIAFGAFGPGCMSEACDERPTLQCWVDQEAPDVLVVHSKFLVDHKEGSVCSEHCKSVTAGCATEPLKAGKYTVKYGDKTFPLRIPSTVTKPCFVKK